MELQLRERFQEEEQRQIQENRRMSAARASREAVRADENTPDDEDRRDESNQGSSSRGNSVAEVTPASQTHSQRESVSTTDRPPSGLIAARISLKRPVPHHLFTAGTLQRSNSQGDDQGSIRRKPSLDSSDRSKSAAAALGGSRTGPVVIAKDGIRPLTGSLYSNSMSLELPKLTSQPLTTRPIEDAPLPLPALMPDGIGGFSASPLSDTILRMPSLHVGSFECFTASYMREAVVGTGVKDIVCLGVDLQMLATVIRDWPEMKFHHQAFPDPATVQAAKQLWPYYQQALDLVHSIYGRGHSVMICCPDGKDIAPSVAMAMLMEMHLAQPERGKMKLKMSFSLVKMRHPITNLGARTRVLLRSREHVLYKELTLREEQAVALNTKLNNDFAKAATKKSKEKGKGSQSKAKGRSNPLPSVCEED